MSIGDKIREQRIKLGLSQEELALKMGYNGRSTIAKIESGAVEVSHTKVVQYAKILGVSVDYLLGTGDDSVEINAIEQPAVHITVGQRIRKRRKELNITLEEIGEYVGVSKATVQRWETGGIANMRRDRIKKLCEILQLDVEELLGGNQPAKPAFVKIPVLGSVAAGVPITAQEDIIGYEEVPAQWTEKDTLFALKIKGDSMEPRMVSGDVVVVRKQEDINSGEVAIVMIGDEEATCKKVTKHSDGLVLISNNPKYAPMFFTIKEIETLPVRILGRVVELRVRF